MCQDTVYFLIVHLTEILKEMIKKLKNCHLVQSQAFEQRQKCHVNKDEIIQVFDL